MDAHATLFEDYIYDMPKIEVVERTGAAPSPGSPGNRQMFCSPEAVEFLGYEWQAIFSFNNEDKLQQVTLVLQKKNAESCRQITSALNGNGWEPVYLEKDGDAFDWLLTKKQEASPTADQQLEEFEQKALAKHESLSVYFFPEKFIGKCLTNKKINSWSEAVDSAPENFRMICLAVDDDNLKLLLTAPLLSRKNALRYGQIIKRK